VSIDPACKRELSSPQRPQVMDLPVWRPEHSVCITVIASEIRISHHVPGPIYSAGPPCGATGKRRESNHPQFSCPQECVVYALNISRIAHNRSRITNVPTPANVVSGQCS